MDTGILTRDSARWIHPPGMRVAAAQPLEAGVSGDERLLGNSDFFRGKSLTELAREQGVLPVKDISVFAGGIPDDEDVDELLAELEALRGA